MKTMNALLLMGLLIFGSSCTNYSPIGGNGSDEESETYYVEMDFFQVSLEVEFQQLNRELLVVREAIEGGNGELRGRLEEIQSRLAQIEQNLDWIASITSGGPIIGGGGTPPPRCEENPDFSVLKPCPVPKTAFENFYLVAEQWQKCDGAIEFVDEKGQFVGGMTGMTEVPESEGFYLEAEFDYDPDRASEVRITNCDVRGQLTTTVYTMQ